MRYVEYDAAHKLIAPILMLFLASLASLPAAGQAVDLRTWIGESYPAVSGFGAGVWNVTTTGDSVTQSVNGQPTLFYSDFDVFNRDVTGRLRMASDGDDDYVGFAIGFRPGDTTSPAADYLLIDWKKGTQYFDFGAPSGTPGSTANRGLAVSRVRGIPTADEFWGHIDFESDTGGELEELARGNTLGDTGWNTNTDYDFRFVFSPARLQVYVNGTLEMNVEGLFADGRLAFYNFSQSSVTYSSFLVESVDFLLALRIAGGLREATAQDYGRLNKALDGSSAERIDILDAIHLVRAASGLQP